MVFNSIYYWIECFKFQEWGYIEGVEIYNRVRCFYSVFVIEVVIFIDYYLYEEMIYWYFFFLVLKF